jgi:sterol desaturase/sphingolipid hydroxylase (fatty acid hydroxylase superfamily)
MFDPLIHAFVRTQTFIHEEFVQPLLFATGGMHLSEMAFDALEWVMIGAIEIMAMVLVLGLLERWMPAEPASARKDWQVDVFYSLLRRLGLVPLLAFALFTPMVDAIESQLRFLDISRLQIDHVWPGVTDSPWGSFLLYLVVFDFVDYWLHRAQHRWSWWWALHAVHHSQRQMTFWTEDRNHVVDDLIRDGVMALIAVAIGVPPAQFIGIVVVSRLVQSLQHANLRWRYGSIGERLLVSPSFHRLHHAVDFGHDGPARGCNFAVLFPVWDVLFGTADYRPGFVPTGIRDQVDGRDYGSGFLRQHWLALGRMFGKV